MHPYDHEKVVQHQHERQYDAEGSHIKHAEPSMLDEITPVIVPASALIANYARRRIAKNAPTANSAARAASAYSDSVGTLETEKSWIIWNFTDPPGTTLHVVWFSG